MTHSINPLECTWLPDHIYLLRYHRAGVTGDECNCPWNLGGWSG